MKIIYNKTFVRFVLPLGSFCYLAGDGEGGGGGGPFWNHLRNKSYIYLFMYIYLYLLIYLFDIFICFNLFNRPFGAQGSVWGWSGGRGGC